MSKVTELTREKVLETICKATRANTLGLFIGSGFTKAMLQHNNNYKAYDWGELLSQACDKMNITRNVLGEGMPYPQVATTMCHEYVKSSMVSFQDAERKLKLIIADLVDVYPSDSMLEKYEGYFKVLDPNWVVTTNYDSIIEQILHEKAFSINPKDSFIKTKDFVPVYHIHGSKSDPDSIVITNEDYTHTLRVSDYRHARLPFLIKESTVLMIGYSLNDLNVLSAVDYCQNVYTNISTAYETPIIQLLYKKYPEPNPYKDSNNIIIQEISDLSEYLSEFSEYSKRFRGVIGKEIKRVNALVEKYTNSKESDVAALIEDKNIRMEIINSVKDIDYEFWYVYPSYTAFLNKAFGILWNNASIQNAFQYYAYILELLLDLIENVNYDKVPASYVDFLVAKFRDIAYFVGTQLGQSWDADRVWKERQHRIPDEFVEEALKRLKDDFDSACAKKLLDTHQWKILDFADF